MDKKDKIDLLMISGKLPHSSSPKSPQFKVKYMVITNALINWNIIFLLII